MRGVVACHDAHRAQGSETLQARRVGSVACYPRLLERHAGLLVQGLVAVRWLRSAAAVGRHPLQLAARCDAGFDISGASAASIPFTRGVGACAPFRLPTVMSTPGSADTLDASRSAAGIDSTVPPADSNSCISNGPSRVVRRATSRPSVKRTRPSFTLIRLSAPLDFQPSRPSVVKSTGPG
eukprot:6172710-Pleurochrysis_carterae.AAC.7